MTPRSNTNAPTYTTGKRFAAIAARVTGMKSRTAVATAAARCRIEGAAVREAIAFANAVDALAANVGPAAKELILSDHPRLPLPTVMRITGT